MKRLYISIIVFFVAVSCTHGTGQKNSPGQVNASILFSNAHCGRSAEPALQWVSNPAELERICGELPKISVNAAPCTASNEIDFSAAGVLLLEMGQKPTAGYGMKLAEKTVRISDSEALVKVHRITPAKGAILPQVISHPCMALRVPLGGYSRIRVIDQDDRLIGELSIP